MISIYGCVDKDLHLCEIMDLDIRSTPKKEKKLLELSGNELVLIACTVRESMLKKSSR